MHSDLSLFRLATAKAEHAVARQTVTAENMAHADTPGYKARDLPPFAEVYRAPRDDSGLRTVHPAHFRTGLGGATPDARPDPLAGNASPNGNTVSIETEMIRASEIKRNHDLALSVYGSGLKLLRAALGR
ncbi:MAG: FlgB family protein [Pseudomonadota bacterium]